MENVGDKKEDLIRDKEKILALQDPPDVSEIKHSFMQSFEKFRIDQDLDLDPMRVNYRVDKVIVQQASQLGESRLGSFNYVDHSLELSTSVTETWYKKHIIYHELLHGICGRTLTESTSNDGKIRTVHADVTNIPKLNDWEGFQRVGLVFINGGNVMLEWLNEAVVEDINMRLAEEDETRGAYEKARELLKHLRTSGKNEISEKLFFDAYFEDYKTDLPQGEKIPKWRKLIRALNEAYEPGILIKIDKLVREEGISAAIKFLQGYDSS